MLTEKDLRELLLLKTQAPVLSIYLNTDPSEGNADAYKLQLRTMLKSVNMPEDVDAIEKYFNTEYNNSGRSVAVFSCQPENFLRAYPLAVPLRSRVRVSDHPHIKPLADLLDSFGGYGVALIDKQGARFFHFHLGELRGQEGVLGESVRHTKRGGASSLPGRRGGTAGQAHHDEDIVERNMKDAAAFAANFFTENNVRRVLIGGTDENIALFRSLLPKTWQSLVVGAFPMSMAASHTEVYQRAMDIGQAAEENRETALVEKLITSAAKGRGGVIRLDDTLHAVHDGRVQTLIIQEGFRAPGFRCLGCGYITAEEARRCPYCSSLFEQINDAVEMAVRQVMQQGGEVEVLHNENLTKEFGYIGAMLRY